MPHGCIAGTGLAVPERVVTNDDLSKLIDTSDEWIRQRTGIEQRHWAVEGETGAGLSKIASERAFAMAGITARDLDAIILATSSPDHFVPGNGVFLQRLLGVGTIPALDIRQACSGFIYSLSVADAWIRAGMFRRILVVGQEIQSTGMDVSDNGRNTAVIFADGAGAVVLEATEDPNRGLLAFDLHSQGEFAEMLWVDSPGSMYHPEISHKDLDEGKQYLQMDGKEVFRHAVTRMPESVNAVVGKLGLGTGDISLLLAHQANLRISEMVQRKLELRDDQVYNNIQKYGNTTAATVPILLDECVRGGRVKQGDLIVMTAFGSGFSWGSVACRW
ncbi:MAG: ketoacyl-ACP synthase III [Gemmatimonadota bacterium]|nr:ketoacyl-ACP synthase III [Gemmatimonadota bacterium]MDH5283033.1 ketoacyl-ACP synthase III [Gemmatimonadota bacterium]